MPSFQIQNKKIKTLQVPYHTFQINNRDGGFSGKRVLPFISGKKKRLPAVITVEAALALPLFLFLAAALILPMRWLEHQQQIFAVSEEFCESASLYLYLKEQDEGQSSEGKEFLSEAAARLWIMGKAGMDEGRLRIVSLQIPDDSGDVYVETECGYELPFFSRSVRGTVMKTASRRRCWIGIDGKLKEQGSSGTERDGEEEMVYVGASLGRYHLSADCHYISNQYRMVAFSQVGRLRNGFGKSYKECSRCAKGLDQGMVYITENGEHYHGNVSCSAMVSYARRVPLKEVLHLGICSYCKSKAETAE